MIMHVGSIATLASSNAWAYINPTDVDPRFLIRKRDDHDRTFLVLARVYSHLSENEECWMIFVLFGGQATWCCERDFKEIIDATGDERTTPR